MLRRTTPTFRHRLDLVAHSVPLTRGILVVVAISLIANTSSSLGQGDDKPSDQPAKPAVTELGKPTEKAADEAVKKIRSAVIARLDDASDVFGNPSDY
ncbi:MAG: hypothetical protein ACKO38_16660, partial [Planctomycetota bacterium]